MSNDPQAPQEPTPANRRIVIDVVRQPMPDLLVRFENVTPAEVFSAAWLLDQLAREVRTQQVMAQAQGIPTDVRPGMPTLAAILASRQG